MQEWVKLPLNPNNTLLWKSVILSYGSLVRKRAIMEKSCSKLDIEVRKTKKNKLKTNKVESVAYERYADILKKIFLTIRCIFTVRLLKCPHPLYVTKHIDTHQS